MCPVCLATMGLDVAGGVSAGDITTYLATRLLPDDAINTPVIAFLASKPASYVTVAQYTMGGEWKRESAAAQDVD